LRKTKLDKDIMTKRFKDFDFNEEYKHLQIKPEQIGLPEEVSHEFDNYDEKYNILGEWLGRSDEQFKLGLYKLRELSREYDDVNDEGIDLPYDIFTQVIIILENANDNILLVSYFNNIV
jgi:hypothetical protein